MNEDGEVSMWSEGEKEKFTYGLILGLVVALCIGVIANGAL